MELRMLSTFFDFSVNFTQNPACSIWSYLPGHKFRLTRHELQSGDNPERRLTFDASLRTDGLEYRHETLNEVRRGF